MQGTLTEPRNITIASSHNPGVTGAGTHHTTRPATTSTTPQLTTQQTAPFHRTPTYGTSPTHNNRDCGNLTYNTAFHNHKNKKVRTNPPHYQPTHITQSRRTSNPFRSCRIEEHQTNLPGTKPTRQTQRPEVIAELQQRTTNHRNPLRPTSSNGQQSTPSTTPQPTTAPAHTTPQLSDTTPSPTPSPTYDRRLCLLRKPQVSPQPSSLHSVHYSVDTKFTLYSGYCRPPTSTTKTINISLHRTDIPQTTPTPESDLTAQPIKTTPTPTDKKTPPPLQPQAANNRYIHIRAQIAAETPPPTARYSNQSRPLQPTAKCHGPTQSTAVTPA